MRTEPCCSFHVRVTLLGSGSEGNALLLESDTSAIVVDAGLSGRELLRRIDALGRTRPTVNGVLVTHGHSDHAAHASTYARRFACPLYATGSTMKSLRLHDTVETQLFTAGEPFSVGNIVVRSKTIPHDAPQVALVFEAGDVRIGLVTDLGHVPRGLGDFIDGCDTLLLESNHDRDMLRNGPYPESLKRRIAGTRGHLSNEQASDLLASLRGAPSYVVLMHLSSTNNSQQLARSSAEAALGHRGSRLLVAPQNHALELPFDRATQLRLAL